MRKKVWTFTPHSGGKKISPETQNAVRKCITEHAEKNYDGKFTRLDIRFRGVLCYIDAYQEPYVPEGDQPEWMNETREQYIERLKNTHLCRIRHFDINRWSVAFYTYSNEKYEPCIFPNGKWFGTPEEAFDIGAVYLER